MNRKEKHMFNHKNKSNVKVHCGNIMLSCQDITGMIPQECEIRPFAALMNIGDTDIGN